jgi:hypothetical protein
MVTCCLEESRYRILQQVVTNLLDQDPTCVDRIDVLDNASTYAGTHELLRSFKHVFKADHNVGYWTAIDWWLDSLKNEGCRYTYIIESDMIHYRFGELDACARLLDSQPEIGSVRLHEYSIAEHHLYNKDAPVPGSRKGLWQSHTNKVTKQPVVHTQIDGGQFWRTNFLTQLPAVNRYSTMLKVFNQLRSRSSLAPKEFTELDFQRLYHESHPEIAILDGGIFHCDLNPYGTTAITGSWTEPQKLLQLGYQPTRFASILPHSEYMVTDLDQD